MLETYYTTPLEDWVNTVYKNIEIYSPGDIEEHLIADSLDIFYSKCEEDSYYLITEVFHMITIDSRLSRDQQREQFFHELCHVLRHAGKQTMMPGAFRELQEAQTKSFQLYAAMPITMIRNLELPNIEHEIIALLSTVFHVSTELAQQRLEQIKRRLYQSELDQQFQSLTNRYKKSDPSNWSDATKAMLQLAVERKIVKEGVLVR